MNDSKPYRRRWLYGPFVLLGLLAAAWTAGWFYAASRTETGVMPTRYS